MARKTPIEQPGAALDHGKACRLARAILAERRMKTVVVFRSRLLPCSETFIREQAIALKRWNPILVGYRHEPDGLDLSPAKYCVIPSLTAGKLARLWLRTCRRLNIGHPPTISTIKAARPSLVHVHFGVDAVDLWPSIRRMDVPVLVTLHGYDINTKRIWWEEGNAGRQRRSYPARLLRLAKQPRVHFIAVSQDIRKQAINYGIAPEKISVRHIGINTSFFYPGGDPISDRPLRILFVGRLIENKGADVLIKAFSQVKRNLPDAELVIVGEGPLRAELEDLAKSLQVRPNFMGKLTSEQVREQLNKTRVLCQPSKTISTGASEAFGMVILESQACGVPVITSSRGGSKEGIQEGVTGFKFHEGDVESLVEALLKLLQNDSLLTTMSHAARTFARSAYDISKCTRMLETLYDDTCEQKLMH